MNTLILILFGLNIIAWMALAIKKFIDEEDWPPYFFTSLAFLAALLAKLQYCALLYNW